MMLYHTSEPDCSSVASCQTAAMQIARKAITANEIFRLGFKSADLDICLSSCSHPCVGALCLIPRELTVFWIAHNCQQPVYKICPILCNVRTTRAKTGTNRPTFLRLFRFRHDLAYKLRRT